MNSNSENNILSRKERERQQHRREIILAAVHLFAQKGFNDTTLEDVASLAEFGKGTIYNHFENKNDLLISSIKFVFEDAQLYLMEQLQDVEDVIERLNIIVVSQFEYYDQNEDFIRLMTSQHKTIIHEMMHANNRELYDRFMTLNTLLTTEFQQAIDSGRIKSRSAKAYTYFLTGMIHGQFRAISMGEISRDEIDPQEILDIFFNGALND